MIIRGDLAGHHFISSQWQNEHAHNDVSSQIALHVVCSRVVREQPPPPHLFFFCLYFLTFWQIIMVKKYSDWAFHCSVFSVPICMHTYHWDTLVMRGICEEHLSSLIVKWVLWTSRRNNKKQPDFNMIVNQYYMNNWFRDYTVDNDELLKKRLGVTMILNQKNSLFMSCSKATKSGAKLGTTH